MEVAATKLLAPHIPGGLIDRPALYSRLEQIKDHKALFVIAPAGYGKSTLLSLWEQTVDLAEYRFSWLILDDVDDAPVRFWSYVLAALERFAPGLRAKITPLVQDNLQHCEVFIDPLINELFAALDASASRNHDLEHLLVLDNYHVVENEAINRAIEYFLGNLPSTLHLVFLTRMVPLLSLGTFLIRNQAYTMNMEDLRFTDDELARYINATFNRRLSDVEVSELQSVIEGWPAAIRHIARNLEHQQSLQHFLQRLKDHRTDDDGLLAAEILAPLSDNEADFLLRISILGRFTVALCDYLAAACDSQMMIEKLEREGLFFVPVNGKKGWYQFHQLVAVLLQEKMEQEHPEQLLDLHGRASSWYDRNGMYGEAMVHAAAARDWDRLAELVETRYRALFQRGRYAFFVRILKALPESLFHQRPILAVARAMASLGAREAREAMRYIGYAEQGLQAIEDDDPSQAEKLRHEIAIIKSGCQGIEGNVNDGISLVQLLLRDDSESDSFIRSWALAAASEAVAVGRDSAEAISILKKCIAIARSSSEPAVELYASYLLGRVYSQLGRLSNSDQVYEQVRKLLSAKGVEEYPNAGLCMIGMSDNERERGNLERAEALLLECLGQASAANNVEFYPRAQISLALLLHAQGDTPRSIQILDGALDYAQEHNILRVVSEIKARLAGFQAETDSKDLAYYWLQNRSLYGNREDISLSEIQELSAARIHAAGNESEKALRVLDSLLVELMEAGRNRPLLEALALRALLLFSQGRAAQAYQPLRESLRLASPEGFIQVYLDEGRPMQYLLTEFCANEPEDREGHAELKGFAASLLRPLSADDARAYPQQKPLLTARESEICKLLVLGYNNREIAQAISISENTVHTHRSSIYTKFQAHNRKELVIAARESGIL
jgi:LuxR family maltose regulon positive regulatory protein